MFAHSSPDGLKPWERLDDHLSAVAKRAALFGEFFGAAELGRLAGYWHDLGKGSAAFQRDVLGVGGDEAAMDMQEESDHASVTGRRRVDHSTAGAQHAAKSLPIPFNQVLAYAIAAHHGRLADWSTPASDAILPKRLAKTIETWVAPADIPLAPADPKALIDLSSFHPEPQRQSFQLSLLTRMIFSALVDADRLETERYCDPVRAKMRPQSPTPPKQLLQQLDDYLGALRAGRLGDPAPVDQHRDAVLQACRDKAALPPGVFSLTVPTGGGKTLASMAFALTHAAHHGQRRVIHALPYTSIIEQTAATFASIFTQEGDVLEHHSNLDAARHFKNPRQCVAYEMAAENFDAPIIVTTNVQLFESLFSAHGSTCRKLHRLAGSVIVLDEAQSIPPRLLRPTLAVLEELAFNYRCTIVLCTATQPAIHRREEFPIGLQHVTEIVEQPTALYQQMQRVTVQDLGACDDKTLAQQLAEHEAVLCIVNTRKHAAELVQLVEDAGTEPVIHLSAAMCPIHRRERVGEIKQRRADRQPCRVVSTQVIEAGVDVDFPVVYRALAGFDSIAQAAGRCNREGRQERGMVYLFHPDHKPALSMQDNVDAAQRLLPDHPDPLALDAIEAYFRQVYWKESEKGKKPWDTKDVMGCFKSHSKAFCAFDFREADARFQWIDSVTTPILVPHGQGANLIEKINQADEPDWTLIRQIQPYTVAVYEREFNMLLNNENISSYYDGRIWALHQPAAYDPNLGLRFDAPGLDPESLNI